jgi:hypothetical protein
MVENVNFSSCLRAIIETRSLLSQCSGGLTTKVLMPHPGDIGTVD